MSFAISSSLSALQAFGTKIDANASNIANSNTEGYKRTRVTMEESTPPGNGVTAQAEKTTNDGPLVYDSSGTEVVEQSNVDLGQEIPDLMMNQNLYEANIKALQTSDELMQTTLDIKA